MPPSSTAAAKRSDNDDADRPSSDQPLAEISDSDLENDDQSEPEEEEEEEEFEEVEEEIEVEEEVIEEVEIEVEEEEEDEEEEEEVVEEEEGGLDSIKEDNVKRNDVSQHMDSEVNDRRLGSNSTPEKSEPRAPSDSIVEDGVCNFIFSDPSNEPLGMQNQESNVNQEDSKYPESGKHLVTARENGSLESSVEKANSEALMVKKKSNECSQPHSVNNTEVIAAEATNPSSIMQKEIRKCLDDNANGVLDSEEKVKPIDMQLDGDKEQIVSRLAPSDTRTRSLSPPAEFKDGNKRPAVICDFFAKGWCIRGSACRFLHINDKEDNTNQQPEGQAAAANLTGEDQFNEGLRVMQKQKLSGCPVQMTSSIENNAAFSCHLSSERILPQDHGESQRLHQLDEKHKFSSLQRGDLSWGLLSEPQQFPSSKCDPGFSSLFKAGIENLRQNCLTTDCGRYASPVRSSSSLVPNGLLFEHRSSSSTVVMSGNCRSGNLSSYSSSTDDMMHVRSQNMHDSGFDTSVLSSGTLPTHCISAWTGSSFSFSSCFNTSPLGSQKLLDGERDKCTSGSSLLLQSASPMSGSEPRDRLHYAEHKAKVSSNDWEPSVPFRPSFFMTSTALSSPGSQYDPLRDSIDLPSIGGKSFKFSFCGQEASILNTAHQRTHVDSLLSWTLGSECNGDKGAISFCNRFHEDMLDKNCRTPGKDLLTTGKVTEGTCVIDRPNGITPEEENASSTGNVKAIPMRNKIDVNHDTRRQSDGTRRKRDLKVDRARPNNEIEVEQKTDGDMLKESKVLRHFRAALVDFVKELLKPTWREGRLSKDAHNTIVKKAVEKVRSTLQPHQVPATLESINQYLSSSRPKITKLVEGYVTKYGKS